MISLLYRGVTEIIKKNIYNAVFKKCVDVVKRRTKYCSVKNCIVEYIVF